MLARRYDTVHLDIAVQPDAYDMQMWGIDKLHPSERGHRMLARSYAELLLRRGLRIVSLPALEPTNRSPSVASQLHWMQRRERHGRRVGREISCLR